MEIETKVESVEQSQTRGGEHGARRRGPRVTTRRPRSSEPERERQLYESEPFKRLVAEDIRQGGRDAQDG